MQTSDYVLLTRQSGLMREMQVVANNVANVSTTGFRREGVVFAEHIVRTGEGSISMGHLRARITDPRQGALAMTGGQLDLAIEGEGYFLVRTPEGDRLTRAGAFMVSDVGDVVTPDGHPLLDAGGAPLAVPADAGPVSVGPDGTVSTPLGPIGQIGLVRPVAPLTTLREGGTRFDPGPEGFEPAIEGRILQGHLEASNVSAVDEITRMIEVQRAYELGQSFLDKEDRRVRNLIETMGK
jgi:flagellar basal-body rod protein FlgF